MDYENRTRPNPPRSSITDAGGADIYHATPSEVRGNSLAFTYLPYNIDRADFMILKTCGSLPMKAAVGGFALSVGAAIPVGAAIADAWFNSQPISMSLRDWLLISCPLGFAILAALIAALLPSERRMLCRRIAKHFQDNPATYSGTRK